jgi:hypothetical protein
LGGDGGRLPRSCGELGPTCRGRGHTGRLFLHELLKAIPLALMLLSLDSLGLKVSLGLDNLGLFGLEIGLKFR